MLDTRSVGTIAQSLGASEQSVMQGSKFSIASLLAGLASKSQDTGLLRHMLDLAPSGDMTLNQVATAASDSNSPLMTSGKRILSGLFGDSEDKVIHAVGNSSGLHAGTASSLLALAAPMVMGFLGKRVRSEGMSMGDLGNTLRKESGTIQSALPAGLAEEFWPTAGRTASPVVAQTVQAERSSTSWLPLLALLLLIPFFFWLFHHGHNPAVPQVSRVIQTAPVGSANRMANEANRSVTSPDAVQRALGNVNLRFNTGSAKLLPTSETQLNRIAATLKANSDVNMKLSGYTDNVGSANNNLQLSQQRANNVMAELVHKGVSSNRLTATGYGDQNPIASNSTATGRAMNRRVSVSVAQP
ncbi:MAG TPA: OmpA family protein [Bryobacteraceae bacterium]|nr:OmpA family protein [Bryobacteraceae bacterium]